MFKKTKQIQPNSQHSLFNSSQKYRFSSRYTNKENTPPTTHLEREHNTEKKHTHNTSARTDFPLFCNIILTSDEECFTGSSFQPPININKKSKWNYFTLRQPKQI